MTKKYTSAKYFKEILRRVTTSAEWSVLQVRIEALDNTHDKEAFLRELEAAKFRFNAIRRTEKQWLSLLTPIKDKQVRAKVASIVWWDYASHCPKIFPLMLQYHCSGFEDHNEVYAELVRIGYPEKLASRRCKQPKDSSYRQAKS